MGLGTTRAGDTDCLQSFLTPGISGVELKTMLLMERKHDGLSSLEYLFN